MFSRQSPDSSECEAAECAWLYMVQVGQAVTVLGGGYGEYAVSKEAMCFPIREASAEAVAITLSGLTAAAALLVGRAPLVDLAASGKIIV